MLALDNEKRVQARSEIMEPLYSVDCQLVGWIRRGHDIWDIHMNWVAYVVGNHAWSAQTGDWLGPVNALTCFDQDGRVVAWNPKQVIRGIVKPEHPEKPAERIRPEQPIQPERPARPVMPIWPVPPMEAWSDVTWLQWTTPSHTSGPHFVAV
jgi:hypothetical protein